MSVILCQGSFCGYRYALLPNAPAAYIIAAYDVAEKSKRQRVVNNRL